MIDSQQLRRLAAGSNGTIVVDHRGEPIEVEGLSHSPPVPSLLVVPVAEAVKQVEDDMIVRHLDRDGLWAVLGFALSGEMVAALPEEIGSPAELIAAVTAAGFEWQVVEAPGGYR